MLPYNQRAMPDTLTLTIPLELHSPNRDRGVHWSGRHKLTKLWEKEIWVALLTTPGGRDWILEPNARERRRLIIVRRCTNRSHFCKDSDNRMFAGKGIRDCLVRLHVLVDDSDRWLESVVLEQKGERAETIIQIERVSLPS